MNSVLVQASFRILVQPSFSFSSRSADPRSRKSSFSLSLVLVQPPLVQLSFPFRPRSESLVQLSFSFTKAEQEQGLGPSWAGLLGWAGPGWGGVGWAGLSYSRLIRNVSFSPASHSAMNRTEHRARLSYGLGGAGLLGPAGTIFKMQYQSQWFEGQFSVHPSAKHCIFPPGKCLGFS